MHSLLTEVVLQPLVVGQTGGGGTLSQAAQNLFGDLKSTMQVIAPLAVVIGCIGAGLMYVLSPIPVVSQWKQQNPQVFSSLFIGIGILIAASTIGSLIAFS